MLELLFCLLGSIALNDLGMLKDGSQVQVTSDDLSVVLATATVKNGELDLSADLRPLSNIVLIISRPTAPQVPLQNVRQLDTTEVIKLNAFVSPSARDIMVQEPQQTISLKDWLEERDIALDVTP